MWYSRLLCNNPVESPLTTGHHTRGASGEPGTTLTLSLSQGSCAHFHTCKQGLIYMPVLSHKSFAIAAVPAFTVPPSLLTNVLLQHVKGPHRAVHVLCVVGDVAASSSTLIITQTLHVIAAGADHWVTAAAQQSSPAAWLMTTPCPSILQHIALASRWQQHACVNNHLAAQPFCEYALLLHSLAPGHSSFQSVPAC